MVTGKNEGKRFFNFYDRNLSLQPFTYGKVLNNPDVKLDIKNYDEMISTAEKLAKPFPLVRVDLYERNNQVLFGELTFTPDACVFPNFPLSFQKEMGAKLTV